MSTLFTSSETRKAVWILKNNKGPRIVQMNVELIKYSPEVVHKKIEDIYNNITTTGKHQNEITHGILRALQIARKTERTNIKSLTNNSFIRS